MKFRSWRTALFLLTIASSALAEPLEIWVSPDGSDRAEGDAANPLATPAMALRKARELRRVSDPSIREGVRILLRDGRYALTEPLWLRPEDSGTATSPTVLVAAPDEKPLLSGGVELSGWKRADGAELRGIPAGAQSHLWISEAPRFSGRIVETRTLWVSGKKGTRARHPNVGSVERLKGWNRENEVASIANAALQGITSGTRAELMVQQQWEIAVLRIRDVTPRGELAEIRFHQPESRIEFEHPWPQPILPPEGAGACFLVNAPEFLDEPGEWYQREDGRILYWPRYGEDLTKADAFVPALESLVVMTGTLDAPIQHVAFEGIAFRHSTWLRPSIAGHVPLQAGLYLIDAYRLRPPGTPDWHKLDNQGWVGRPPAAVALSAVQHVQFRNCEFAQMAMTGLDFVSAAQHSRIEGCTFDDIGGNAIMAGAFNEGPIEAHLPFDPNDSRVVCSNLKISNNFIHDGANEDWGCVGIAIGYARDVVVEHNELTNLSYTGISLGWGWTRTLNVARNHIVRGNLIHHIATRMCDTAGVYTLSAQPGTLITENVVHSITMSPYVDRPDHWFYLYLDEGSSYVRVLNNWCPEERFLKNANGPGNIWENNGPGVSDEIKSRAGLQAEFLHLRTRFMDR